MNRYRIRTTTSRALLLVFAFIMSAFFALPLLWLLTAPFSTQANLAVKIPETPSLANFEAVFRNKFAIRALFQNNLILGGGVMVLVASIAVVPRLLCEAWNSATPS